MNQRRLNPHRLCILAMGLTAVGIVPAMANRSTEPSSAQEAAAPMAAPRAPASGASLPLSIRRADWIVTGHVTAHMPATPDSSKPAAFKVRVDAVVSQSRTPVPTEVDVRAYAPLHLLDGTIHAQLAEELMQPAPTDVADYTRAHPAIALSDLAALGQSGDGPALVRYAREFDKDARDRTAYFDLDRANAVIATSIALGDQGDEAARQFAAELVAGEKRFAGNGAEGAMWDALGRWKRADLAPKALEILAGTPPSSNVTGEDVCRGYFPALRRAAAEEYGRFRAQVTDPKLSQRLDAPVADTTPSLLLEAQWHMFAQKLKNACPAKGVRGRAAWHVGQ